MKKTFIFTFIFLILFGTSNFAQIKLSIMNEYGIAVGITKIDVYDGKIHLPYTTNLTGQVTITPLNIIPCYIYITVPDKKGICGASVVQKYIGVTATTITITVPNFPSLRTTASSQIDQILTLTSTAITLDKWTTTITKMNADLIAGRPISYSLPAMGVPGLFSVDPIPRIQNGKLVLKISGVLVDEILQVMNLLNSGKWSRVQYSY